MSGHRSSHRLSERQMVRLFAAVIACAVCGVCLAEGFDPDYDTEIPGPVVVPDDKTTDAEIRLPEFPPGPGPVEPVNPPDPVDPPKPVEPPKPQPVTALAADHWYVIESDAPFFVLDSRVGIVLIGYEEGPLKLKGKFADGTGKNETRVYSAKYLATVEAVTKGQVELMVVPAGATEAGVVLRRTLTVMGQAPQPPPDPDVDPEPDVDPAPGPPDEIMVLMLYDQTGSRDQLNTVHSTSLTEWLNKNCKTSADNRPEWRKWDRTSVSKPGMLDKETPAWQTLWKDLQSQLPADKNVIVVRTDKEFVIHSMAGPDDSLAFLNRVKGGK